MDSRFPILLCIIAVVLTSGCNGPENPNNESQGTVELAEQVMKKDLPLSVAGLPEMDLSTVEGFEKFQKFADTSNALIDVLNEHNELFDIPRVQKRHEAYSKASTTITEYGPLVGSYNRVIHTARIYEESQTDDNLIDFYKTSGGFALEIGVITWAVFYRASYYSVGFVYRAVGLNKLAFKHPKLVSHILSNAHWTVRNTMVTASSQLARQASLGMIEGLQHLSKIPGALESSYDNAKSFSDSVMIHLTSQNSTTNNIV